MGFIDVKNLVFKYKSYINEKEATEKTVIDDLSLSVEKGSFVGILGHNGSGKSTFARQLVALLHPAAGEIRLDDLDVLDEKNALQVRQRAGIVFQNPDNQFVANLVEEDVAFGLENLGVEREEMEKRINLALEATNMTAYRDKNPGCLSGGQKQRVAISGILAMEPSCIILDEPTAMLDPVGRQEVLSAVRYLNQNKKITILYITHHVDEVMDADYLYVMERGKIALEGKPSEVLSAEKMKEVGLELPFLYKLRQCLKERGLELPRTLQTQEEILEYLAKRCAPGGGAEKDMKMGEAHGA